VLSFVEIENRLPFNKDNRPGRLIKEEPQMSKKIIRIGRKRKRKLANEEREQI
jgi:hypothetical protein